MILVIAAKLADALYGLLEVYGFTEGFVFKSMGNYGSISIVMNV